MDKQRLRQTILDRLFEDLQLAREAAQAARDAATHEESTAENKYDTFGLESAYLAEGQSRRVREIEQAVSAYRNLQIRQFDADSAVQLSALVLLDSPDGAQRWLFLGPDAAGLKVMEEGQEIYVITPRSPMGQTLIGKAEGDSVVLNLGLQQQTFEIVEIC